jgi:hypothetical protein
LNHKISVNLRFKSVLICEKFSACFSQIFADQGADLRRLQQLTKPTMKKSYKIILSLILLLPAFTGIAQDHLFKSKFPPALGASDSRFTVMATVMDNDTWCRVEWPDPIGNPWELAYDDGEADDFFVYSNPGSLNANKFIPQFHPFIVTGGKIYVGDGSFPGPFLGTSFRVLVYDDDGEDGLPGTALDSMDVTVENYEWVEFEGMTAEITEGNFYLAMKQLAPSPDAAPVGVDMDNPTYSRSYSHFLGGPGWVLCPLQDLMIRAFITAYDEPSREIDSFEVARFYGFGINESPLQGDTAILDTTGLSEYNDYAWDNLEIGRYAYGIRTHFTNGTWSDYDVSNILSRRGDGNPLPFLEQWNSGTFGTNNWLPEGENWSINGNEGNPDPSAQFTWDPIQSDYSIALESYPLLADSMTEGQIYLDFDLKLDDVTPTGTEQMLVQVWNWDSQTWTAVNTYSNEDGSFDWLSEHIDITSQAIGTVFKIRFLASGENSINILSWFVDNIHVYRDCKGPNYLTSIFSYQYQGIVLNWDDPYGPGSQWMHWDDGINAGNSIGIGGEIEFDVAARWVPQQLVPFNGYELEKVAFFPAEAQASYNVRVWTGTNAETLVADQPVPNPVIGEWNYIILDSSIMIDITKELWVGYYVNTVTGYPAGVDDGPAIDGYGNMMNFGGWQTLLQINPELDFNWNIKAYVQQSILNQVVTKYGIYRSDDSGPFALRAYSDTNFYADDSAICASAYFHCYKVTAIYESPYDTCESPMPYWDACEMCWKINENDPDFNVNIYPNPASDVLFIESSENIELISIFNSQGEEVRRRRGEEGKMSVPVDGLVPGLYLVHLETSRESVNRKIIIKH